MYSSVNTHSLTDVPILRINKINTTAVLIQENNNSNIAGKLIYKSENRYELTDNRSDYVYVDPRTGIPQQFKDENQTRILIRTTSPNTYLGIPICPVSGDPVTVFTARRSPTEYGEPYELYDNIDFVRGVNEPELLGELLGDEDDDDDDDDDGGDDGDNDNDNSQYNSVTNNIGCIALSRRYYGRVVGIHPPQSITECIYIHDNATNHRGVLTVACDGLYFLSIGQFDNFLCEWHMLRKGIYKLVSCDQIAQLEYTDGGTWNIRSILHVSVTPPAPPASSTLPSVPTRCRPSLLTVVELKQYITRFMCKDSGSE